MQNLLTLTARCLSHQSLLHIGYREIGDQEKLITERHRYNLESVDGKMLKKEFVIASLQQQEVIASFTASPTKRHLVLEGPAGTGKTLVALQVVNNLIGYTGTTLKEPLLVVTTQFRKEHDPIMQYLNTGSGKKNNKIFMNWMDITRDSCHSTSVYDTRLIPVAEAVAKKWEGREIVMLVDEIDDKDIIGISQDCRLPELVFREDLCVLLPRLVLDEAHHLDSQCRPSGCWPGSSCLRQYCQPGKRFRVGCQQQARI